MVSILAAREGVSPVVYYHTRTHAEFVLGTYAWIESVATPAAMLLGSQKAGGTSHGSRNNGHAAVTTPALRGHQGRRERYESLLGIARKYRSGRGTVRETIHDLDELLPLGKEWTPESRHRIKAAASQALSARIGR